MFLVWILSLVIAIPVDEFNFVVHTPSISTIVTMQNFHYFKIYFPDVGHFFEKQKEWNRNYLQAQAIYGSNSMSFALRAAIRTQHSILYTSRLGSYRGTMARNSTSFFELLQAHRDTGWMSTKEDSIEVYTYVLMPESLRFSRTGAQANIDFSSKHALHAGASPTVTYAGEFWVQVEDGQKVLYMDNNSGTFAPPKEDLFRIKNLMEYEYKGMKVVVLDYNDPLWKDLRNPNNKSPK